MTGQTEWPLEPYVPLLHLLEGQEALVGGGIVNTNSTLTIVDSTIADNQAIGGANGTATNQRSQVGDALGGGIENFPGSTLTSLHPHAVVPSILSDEGKRIVLPAFFQQGRDAPDKTRQTLTTAHRGGPIRRRALRAGPSPMQNQAAANR